MKVDNQKQAEVRQVIDNLIQTATNYDIDVLDEIYHDDMTILMVDPEENVNTAVKQTFIDIFRSKRDAGDPPMNTWAKYHHISVTGDNAHVLLSRKNNLNGHDMYLTLSIDLSHLDGRWQVVREVIFLKPDTE